MEIVAFEGSNGWSCGIKSSLSEKWRKAAGKYKGKVNYSFQVWETVNRILSVKGWPARAEAEACKVMVRAKFKNFFWRTVGIWGINSVLQGEQTCVSLN